MYLAKLSQNRIDKIVSQLSIADRVGIDETGVKVNGNRDWNWVFQNDSCTFIAHPTFPTNNSIKPLIIEISNHFLLLLSSLIVMCYNNLTIQRVNYGSNHPSN